MVVYILYLNKEVRIIISSKSKLTSLEKHWIMYDIGNSAFILLISTIIPIYFKNIASESGISASNSTAYWGYAVSISTLIVAIIGPILGTLADTKGYKKPLFTVFLLLGAIGCAVLSISVSWLVFLFIFVIAKVGISGSLIFYDSMLPDVTAEDKMDLLSSLGYAWGYIGSCAPFTLSLVIILFSDRLSITASNATKFAFILTAAWWTAASFPLLKNYRQIYYVETKKNAIQAALFRLKNTFMDIKN